MKCKFIIITSWLCYSKSTNNSCDWPTFSPTTDQSASQITDIQKLEFSLFVTPRPQIFTAPNVASFAFDVALHNKDKKLFQSVSSSSLNSSFTFIHQQDFFTISNHFKLSTAKPKTDCIIKIKLLTLINIRERSSFAWRHKIKMQTSFIISASSLH